MENKCKRFLSLLLALVMVIGMMPVGQVRAEESAAPVISAAAKVVGGSYVSLADCEYTFEKTGDTISRGDYDADSWYISSWVGGIQYYVDAYGTAQHPYKNTKSPVGIVDLDSPEGSVRFYDDAGYLHFHTEANNQYWNQCTGTHNNNEAVHSVMIFERGEDAESPIPGYKQVTTVENIDDGGRYLIVAEKTEGTNAGYYAMHPTKAGSVDNSTNVNYHAAKIVTNVELVTLNQGETKVITVPGENTVVSSASAAVVTVAGAPALTRHTVATTATQPAEGNTLPEGKYVFVNRRMGTALLTDTVTENNGGANRTGLSMGAYPSNAEVWTVKKVANVTNGYTVQASNGKYLSISKEGASMSAAPVTLSFAWNKATNRDEIYRNGWAFAQNGQYLCQFGAADTIVAAGYNVGDDPGAQWDLYAVSPAQEYTWTRSENPVAAIESDHYYILENNVSVRLASSAWNATGNGENGVRNRGLKLVGTKDDFTEKNIWHITGSTDNWNVKDLNGWSLSIGDKKATMTTATHAIKIAHESTNGNYAAKWQISEKVNNTDYHFNWWGGSHGTGDQLAGYSNVNDSNNQWNIYEVTRTPVYSTAITFTAVAAGNTTVTHGDTTYVVHVHGAPASFAAKASNCGTGTNGCEAGTWCQNCEVTLSGGAEVKWQHNIPADDGNCATAVACAACNYVDVAAKTHQWNNGDCTNDGCDKTWDFLANMTLGNDLKAHFAFEKALMTEWTDCYAVIKKGDEIKTIPIGEWADTGIKGDDYYYVTFDGIAAKEMTDEFTVTIYNAGKTAISEEYSTTIAQYAKRYLENGDNDAYKTVLVDMLNYGAEAQEMFNYKTGNMANANLTEEQKGFATEDVSLGNELVKTGNVDYLANVKLESNIQFMMAFTGIDPETMTATVAFTNWNGKKHENIPCSFVKSGGYHYITIEETVIADGRLPITCTIKEGDKVIATVTDSIESYAARAAEKNSDNADLYQALMKFSDSACEYLTEN